MYGGLLITLSLYIENQYQGTLDVHNNKRIALPSRPLKGYSVCIVPIMSNNGLFCQSTDIWRYSNQHSNFIMKIHSFLMLMFWVEWVTIILLFMYHTRQLNPNKKLFEKNVVIFTSFNTCRNDLWVTIIIQIKNCQLPKRVFFYLPLLIPANCFIEMKITVRFLLRYKKKILVFGWVIVSVFTYTFFMYNIKIQSNRLYVIMVYIFAHVRFNKRT